MDFLKTAKIRKLWKKMDGERPRRTPSEQGLSRGRRFFEQLVREAVESLPEELKNRLENVAFLVREDPPRRSKKWLKNDQELLGLYHGISHKDRGFWYGNVLPDRITIYRKPLERVSENSQELRENVRQTVVHEVGHYFGFDEEALRRLEDGDF